MDNKYHEARGNKWIFTIVGFFLIGLFGYWATPYLYQATHSSYNRKGLESIADWKFGAVKYNN